MRALTLAIGFGLISAGCSDFVEGESSGSGSDGGSTSTGPSSESDDSDPTSGQDPTTDPTSPTDPTDPTDPTNPTDPTDGTDSADPTEATGSTSGSESTGTRGDESSTGGGAATCGDSFPEGNEACDDGNDDELDGCTSNCQAGPTAIAFGAITSTALDGGSGGTNADNTDVCPAGSVLVGLAGFFSNEGWLGRIRGLCRSTALTNTDPPVFSTSGDLVELPERGQFIAGGPWSTECPADEVVIAIQGSAGSVMDGVQIRCGSVDTVGPSGSHDLDPMPGAWLAHQGSDGGSDFGPLACAAGTVAMGLRATTSSYVNQLQLQCQDIGLTY